ncbi:electron transfer flavoprotein subunit alpha/FixB family protein [Clostridium sp.]|uniref:electron transfer flavoprotein subunit alpha/FixB family protein n=1 Tax=Clostridium sp. TaxID=1506 RepID=UPI003F2CEC85
MLKMKVNRGINLEDWKGVLVIAEQRYGKILNVSYELLGEAKKLANELDTYVSIAVLGNELDDEIDELVNYGADKVIYFEHKLLENYTTDAYCKVLSEFILENKPESVLVGATAIGRDLAPRVAGRVGTGLTADCTKLDIDMDNRRLLQTRPAFGGNLMATIICPNNRPQMSTVRPGVMEKAKLCDTKSELIKISPQLTEEDIIAKVVEVLKDTKEKVSLSDAEVIVAGGRGVGNQEGFKLIEELAELLGGTYASSRAAVDNGWVDANRQIGQTGTTVRPKVYIACGISGAIQHISGMSESDCIIAINKNENAPIFEIAHYQLVGDLFKLVPELINTLKQKESQQKVEKEYC